MHSINISTPLSNLVSLNSSSLIRKELAVCKLSWHNKSPQSLHREWSIREGGTTQICCTRIEKMKSPSGDSGQNRSRLDLVLQGGAKENANSTNSNDFCLSLDDLPYGAASSRPHTHMCPILPCVTITSAVDISIHYAFLQRAW